MPIWLHRLSTEFMCFLFKTISVVEGLGARQG